MERCGEGEGCRGDGTPMPYLLFLFFLFFFFFSDLAGGKKLQATIEYKDAGAVYLTLVDPQDNLNVAFEMVQGGFARLERSRRRHLGNPVVCSSPSLSVLCVQHTDDVISTCHCARLRTKRSRGG